jgi:hypothetical protein
MKTEAPSIGAKHDAGKPRPSLVFEGFPHALAEVVAVAGFGAERYGDHNWKLVDNARARYAEALYRHLLAHASGERLDSDSGLSHLAHAAWNVLAVLQLKHDMKADHHSV